MPHGDTVAIGGVTWVNGAIVAGAGSVRTDDHGFLLGDGVFETFLARRGRVIALGRHLARLIDAAERVGLSPVSEDEIRAAIGAVSSEMAVTPGHPRADSGGVRAARGGTEAQAGDDKFDAVRIRVTVTSGPGPSGLGRGSRSTLVVSGERWTPPSGGVHAIEVPWRRNERGFATGLKTISRVDDAGAIALARTRGASEVVWRNTRGEVCEGSTSNIFVECDGEFVTPELSSGCLPGVARACLLAVAGGRGLTVREGTVGGEVLDAVRGGDARLFVTSAVRGVAPVVAFDDVTVTHGAASREFVSVWEAVREQFEEPIPRDT